MLIRPAHDGDADAIWDILAPILAAGETYALPRNWDRAEALAYWNAPGHTVFVAEDAGIIHGTYYLQANQQGGGAHVANCGFATRQQSTGKGMARAMCAHALTFAARQGFRAMQFNFVVSTNHRAVALWESFGFQIVGTLPGAFEHPMLGFVDAYVMYRLL